MANLPQDTQKEDFVAKPEWGTKRQCPACGGRFYDLGKVDPVVCIKCDNAFEPEILLKPRRGRPDDKAVETVKAAVLDDLEADEIDTDGDTVSLEELDDQDVDVDEDDDAAVVAKIPDLVIDDDLDLDLDEDADDHTLLETDDDDDADILPRPTSDD
ncbi:MAG: TIGR02300 family protein [Pseudomonadota bacterium]